YGFRAHAKRRFPEGRLFLHSRVRGDDGRPHNSLALENANDVTRLVFSPRFSVRVIGGSARWVQFSRSQSRQLTPIGVPSVFSRSMPVAYTSLVAWRISQPSPMAKRGCACGCGAT